MYVYIYIYVNIYIYMYMCVCVCVCMCVCLSLSLTHKHTFCAVWAPVTATPALMFAGVLLFGVLQVSTLELTRGNCKSQFLKFQGKYTP